MKDHSPIKIVCRIINLLIYVCTIFCVAVVIITELFNEKQAEDYFNNYIMVICICAIPAIIIMIISLIIKYTMENKSKVNIYGILDTFTRIIVTIPTSITAIYYIIKYTEYEPLIHIIIFAAIFLIIDKLMKFTLQETLEVAFITSDNL